MKKTLLALAVLLPLSALAAELDYSDRSSAFVDAPFNDAEAAGISVLTNLGAVQGNPDGTFAPGRGVNRAEFLKIAFGSHPTLVPSSNDAMGCFPDVKAEDWFSSAVCVAKFRGIASGYPDGWFRPANPVNYAESLKMLVELYELPVEDASGEWYAKYVNAAAEHDLLLRPSVFFDAALTRGQVARLAAAFRADAEGELDLYRKAERGETVVRSSSAATSKRSSAKSASVSSSSAASVNSLSSGASAASTSSSAYNANFPARSRILLLGERSKPIAGATFFSSREAMIVRTVKVKMEAKYESIDSLYFVDQDGKQIARLSLDPFDTTDKTWKATLGSETSITLPKDEQTILGIEALLKPINAGGESQELLQVDEFSLTVEGEWTAETYQSLPSSNVYPEHQTAAAKVTGAKNAMAEKDALSLGSDQLIAAFSFSGVTVPTANLAIEHLTFQVSRASTVTVSGWELRSPDSSASVTCSVSNDIVSCSTLPAELGTIGSTPRVLRLYGDITLQTGAKNAFLQVSLNQPGTISENGAIRWTDGTGHFNWIEGDAPLARGTRWE
ncbi:MAG: S-layer homology domain-containing protein [Candidatus Peregrinibacteria bacterium]|nr:S-layer homology domain-containing protein [Candidatus Peregrinibacteria bacterium]